MLKPESIFPAPFRHTETRPERVLLIGYFDPRGISTVPEILASIRQFSVFQVVFLNLFDHRHDSNSLALNPEIDLDAFDVVIVHNSVAYNPANLVSLDRLIDRKFARFDGVKVLFKQDENFHFRETAAAIAAMRFDIVLTCLPKSEWEKIYPREIVGTDVQFWQMLTGYVTPGLRQRYRAIRNPDERPVDIGYRGSIQPLDFGRLCYEKRQIGDEVRERLASTGLNLDISSRWEDRFGGEAWFEFLSRCKCTLGVESGASIFDLDGSLDSRVSAIVAAIGPESEDPQYCEQFLDKLRDLEGNVAYNQISPRHFEAAACGTVQIMYPGSYSGVFLPERHYLTLEPDFSNLEEIAVRAMDPTLRQEIAARAYEEIVLNPKFGIETFVGSLDALVLECLESKGRRKVPRIVNERIVHHGLLLAPHRVHLDPRLKWFMDMKDSHLAISAMGLQMGAGVTGPSPLEGTSGFLGDMPIQEDNADWLTDVAAMVGNDIVGNAVLRELLEVEKFRGLGDLALAARYGASPRSRRLVDFRWSLGYLLNVTRSLLFPALDLRGIGFVVAADLPTLPAALILKATLAVSVAYDAHEYWPENDGAAEPFEIEFWQGVERRLARHADLRQAVSPGLARILTAETECHYGCVPNCATFKSLDTSLHLSDPPQCVVGSDLSKRSVRFLFQGLLTPGRGLEELIRAWPDAPPEACLALRGPEGEFKAELRGLAIELRLPENAIEFLPPVAENELIAAAKEFDVGLIPYPPINTNNKNCCPNKLSQYMAAGLPILANDTNYVRQVVEDAGCGLVVDFGKSDQLIERVRQLVDDKEARRRMACNSRMYFETTFNWESVSTEMLESIRDLLSTREPNQLLKWPTSSCHLYKPALLRKAYSRKPAKSYVERAARRLWRAMPPSVRSGLRPAVDFILSRQGR